MCLCEPEKVDHDPAILQNADFSEKIQTLPNINEGSAPEETDKSVTAVVEDLNGSWHRAQDKNDVCAVLDGQVTWNRGSAGTQGELSMPEKGRISLRLLGKVFLGTVQEDGDSMCWDDGDVWQRTENNTQNS